MLGRGAYPLGSEDMLEFETWNLEPGTWNLEIGAWSRETETLSLRPATCQQYQWHSMERHLSRQAVHSCQRAGHVKRQPVRTAEVHTEAPRLLGAC